MDLSFIPQLWEQVTKSPAWLVIAGVLNVIVFLWRWAHFCNNRFIPWVCVLGGMLLYFFFGPMETIPKTQRHPEAFMLLLGVLLGFLSWAMNGGLTKLIRTKVPDFLQEETTTTNDKKQ